MRRDAEIGLRRVILDCAYLRLELIARQVREVFRHRPASGAYGIEEHTSAWDEYRYEVGEGPTPTLDSSWDVDLYQIINPFVGDLMQADAVLCSVAMSFMMDGDEAGLTEEPAVYKDAIVWGIRQQLYELADEENFRKA